LFPTTTKGLAAMTLAIAHSRGWLDYDKRVCSYWPEFAQQGKERITVRQLLAHQAGLFTFDEQADRSLVAGLDRLAVVLARQKPGLGPFGGVLLRFKVISSETPGRVTRIADKLLLDRRMPWLGVESFSRSCFAYWNNGDGFILALRLPYLRCLRTRQPDRTSVCSPRLGSVLPSSQDG
jgi:hypothetical protein